MQNFSTVLLASAYNLLLTPRLDSALYRGSNSTFDDHDGRRNTFLSQKFCFSRRPGDTHFSLPTLLAYTYRYRQNHPDLTARGEGAGGETRRFTFIQPTFTEMVQSLNTKALLALASVVRRPSLLVPHVSLDNVSQLHYQALKDRCGIRAIVFDKDNTLTAPYGLDIHPDASEGLQAAKSVFGIENVAIMSNSAGTMDDPDYEDAKRIEEALGIAVIRHDEKKPGGLPEVLAHFKVDDPATLCMVGDRLLTDVVFGNLYGMLTVHTLPLCKGSDNSQDNTVAKVIRSVENMGLYGNWFGGRYMLTKRPQHKFWPGEEECPLRMTQETSS